MINFVAIDFETATAQRNSACEIGLTVVKNGIIEGVYSHYIKPVCYPEFSFYNRVIHGISPEDVADSPEFPTVWETAKKLIECELLVAHNAAFDRSVLDNTMKEYNITPPDFQILCTYKMAKKAWPNLLGFDLESLCSRFNIELLHHNAGSDSEAAAKLALLAAQQNGISTTEELKAKFPFYQGNKIIADKSLNNPDSIFHGKKVVFTGQLTSLNRNEAMQKVVDIGGTVSNTLTNDTNFLIIGEQVSHNINDTGLSGKQKKVEMLIAKGYEIEIMTEEDFFKNI